MSERQTRKEVNDAIISTGSAGVGQMVDAANSSKRKREENKRLREARDKAAKEQVEKRRSGGN